MGEFQVTDFGIDTSALVRILTRQPPLLAEKVKDRIEDILNSGATIFVSNLVVSEAYIVLQRFYHATKEDAISLLLGLSQLPGFEFDSEAVSALSKSNAATMSPGMVDCMIAGEYAERGLRILACEKDFRRFPGAEVIEE